MIEPDPVTGFAFRCPKCQGTHTNGDGELCIVCDGSHAYVRLRNLLDQYDDEVMSSVHEWAKVARTILFCFDKDPVDYAFCKAMAEWKERKKLNDEEWAKRKETA